MKQATRLILTLYGFIYLTSCKPVPVSHWFPVTPQEHYEKELYQAKLEKTQAGQSWFQAGKTVLDDTLFSVAPYQERLVLDSTAPAQALRFKIPEGRKLVITPMREQNDTISKLFVEIYRVKTSGKHQRIDYMKDGEAPFIYTNQNDDTLLIRLQTGLKERLIATLSLTTLPSLIFPVANHNMSDVISAWGAERDAGARSHEGIDIRAKRGTPVVAAKSGLITQVGTNNLGGKIVFLSVADSPYSLYYAHLDSQLVSAGQRVIAGDTLGLVGNTGNAITTSPHLHFGIYARGSGAVNPLPFVNDRKEKIPGLPEQSKWLGDSVNLRKQANMFTSPLFLSSGKITSLPAQSTVKLLAETTKGYRIQLPDGTKGYIPTVPITGADVGSKMQSSKAGDR
ncbi:M23 family metallopeptidase [Dyadobacter sp. CY312]|uniref:peptidoglycan DD-metalloendopeptidase family protein n=1 Tax=Dyadobacter sp. CY312 TaxID=2907303 RepID=UPI001F330835|nr:M23 family metallopeptidase [Dyadobacter sp. CY312]MCE7041845.1 M23 family metallopeptidase [Dyadobacter sp. CY312]